MRRNSLIRIRSLLFGILLLASATVSTVAAPDLMVRVIDARTGNPIVQASVAVIGTSAGGMSDTMGVVILSHDQFPYRVQISHVAYQTATMTIESWEDTVVELVPRYRELGTIQVIGEADVVNDVTDRSVLLDEESLVRALAPTIAQSLANEPGVRQRSMGPAPARPVLRGLDGHRLPVLADGQATGDLSATSSDHAVAIEPLTAEKIEVVRGPASLLFGSATLGGAVNVRTTALPQPTEQPLAGAMTVSSNSGTNGLAGHGDLTVSTGPLAVRVTGYDRSNDDLRGPDSTLPNSWMRSDGWSLAGALTQNALNLTGGYAAYTSSYAIPGGFLGGHENGVRINLWRKSWQGELDWRTSNELLSRVRVRLSQHRFFQREDESSGVCGVSFGTVTYNGSAMADVNVIGSRPLVAGLLVQYRDYAQGCLAFSPPTEEIGIAGVLLQRFNLSPRLMATAAGRVDWFDVDVNPIDRTRNKAGDLVDRQFSGFSGGLELRWRLTSAVTLESELMRAWRAPATEELFSDGPHLAAYSYEVGNSTLSAEAGWGIDFGTTITTGPATFRANGFYNRYDRYLFPSNTGEVEVGPGSGGFLPRYQYIERPTEFVGGELSATARFGRWVMASDVSLTQGTLTDSREPLPFISPVSGQIEFGYHRKRWQVDTRTRWASSQTRTGAFESATAGYAVVDLSAAISTELLHRDMIISVEVRNLFDAEYRDHLSRIRSVFPEPGRSAGATIRYQL